ncbi:DUF934 domain-containing protein [Rhodovulum euryhalinum]|uniref:Uncharacterized protein DUF934 n=1 Tax=Rhodovulum euryhalinum TaxID=35805 RepID=A0A4V2SAH2_9RHOB|nr:DUF934 domain-containing protein [Rhodovulum euryhalinum]TCO71660.1 uncharacterized protein DUF934 [Rhodovulum euryhalinum]
MTGAGGSIIVTDAGFAVPVPGERFVPLAILGEATPRAVDLAPEDDPAALAPLLHAIAAIRIAFPVFSDGRGFSLARDLRRMGFRGRLRAAGHLIADQYPLARACGFDEVEIGAELAARQPEADWRCAACRGRGYLDRIKGPEPNPG